MGMISSKFLKSDSKPVKVCAAVQTETPKQTTEIPDVRSPSADIVRTPILVEKLKNEEEFCKEHKPQPLRNKLLKSLKLDPRSPTEGIYRTPILIEDSPSSKTPNSFDSPVSTYSTNVTNSFPENIMTPIEPSMNVSGFEFPKEIFCGEDDVTLNCDEVNNTEGNKSCLRVLDRPNTYEAKKLLEEIISDEENFLKKVKMPSKKEKKSLLKKMEQNVSYNKGKSRTPLSNITSSTNSPSGLTSGLKVYSRNKVMPEFGSENSAVPNTKQVVQWDQNNTVII